MIRLLYFSTLTPGITAEDIVDIVDKAAARNADIGVTGLLAIEGHRVCQILEGDEVVVGYLYESIRRDARHDGVIEMDRREIPQRGYAEWSMVRRPMVDMVLAALRD